VCVVPERDYAIQREIEAEMSFGRLTRTTFEQVKTRGEKSGKCKCGVQRKRAKTFMQTINPFNTHKRGKKEGCTKTREDILVELKVEVQSWKREKIVCQECE
jgi:hypothetical protein